MSYIGTTDWTKVYKGTQEALKIYRGTELVWAASVIPMPPVTTGLILYLNSSVVSSVQLRNAGGIDYVEQWNDLSGNNRHVLQPTQAAQPTYVNNRITFNGTNQFVRSNAFNQTFGGVGNDAEFIIQKTYNSIPASGSIDTLTLNEHGSTTPSMAIFTTSDRVIRVFSVNSSGGSANAGPSRTYTVGQTLIFSGRIETSSSQVHMRHDNLQSSYGQANVRPFSQLILGVNTPMTGAWFNGTMQKIVVYNRQLTTEERTDVFNWMSL